MSEKKHNPFRRPASLCWYCANAVPSAKTGCNWSINFEPIDGWDAKVTDDMHRNELGEESIAYGKHAYLVKDCPEFVPDSPEFSKLHARYDAGLNALALDVIKISVVDLIPRYKRLLDVQYRRGYRFAQINCKIVKLRIPHQNKMHDKVKKDIRKIRQRIHMFNTARKKFPGCPRTLDAIHKEVSRLYKTILNMRIPSEDREMSIYSSYKSLKRFFLSDYAFHLSELDPVVLFHKVLRQIEDENDIPQVDFIVKPQKRLKKGIRYGTGK